MYLNADNSECSVVVRRNALLIIYEKCCVVSVGYYFSAYGWEGTLSNAAIRPSLCPSVPLHNNGAVSEAFARWLRHRYALIELPSTGHIVSPRDTFFI